MRRYQCLDIDGKLILPTDSVQIVATGEHCYVTQWDMCKIDGICLGKERSYKSIELRRTSKSDIFHKIHESPETLEQLIFPFMYDR